MSGILYRDLALHQISPAIVDNDILIFFEHRLGEIRNVFDDLPANWPGKETINHLVLKAHGLFIYAATVCQFIEESGEQWPRTTSFALFFQTIAQRRLTTEA
jgi:hypothetical protein